MIVDTFDEMLEQSAGAPLVMGIALHAYIVGQPLQAAAPAAGAESHRRPAERCVDHNCRRDRVTLHCAPCRCRAGWRNSLPLWGGLGRGFPRHSTLVTPPQSLLIKGGEGAVATSVVPRARRCDRASSRAPAADVRRPLQRLTAPEPQRGRRHSRLQLRHPACRARVRQRRWRNRRRARDPRRRAGPGGSR